MQKMLKNAISIKIRALITSILIRIAPLFIKTLNNDFRRACFAISFIKHIFLQLKAKAT